MAKCKERWNFCGTNFEVYHDVVNGEDERRDFHASIYDVYDRPSRCKENIYYDWRDFFYDNCYHVLSFGVRSYNCSIFTLQCKAQVKYFGKPVWAVFEITPAHNVVTIYDL